MDKTIAIAKCTLAEIFDINIIEFDRKITRRRNVIEARRFLIFFLADELGMKFLHIPKEMKSITSHATAMHHFYKMIDLLRLEEKTRSKYLEFKNLMQEKGLNTLQSELVKQKQIQKFASWNIKQLKEMINEA